MSGTLSSRSFCIAAFFCLLAKLASAGPAGAPISGDRDIDARMAVLTQTLDDQEIKAEYWEYGWGAFDTGTMIYSAAEAAADDNRKDRNADIVNAAESLIGLADLVFRPLPAFSADTLCRDPLLTRADEMQCLEAREAMLKSSAARAHEPYEWLPHLGNLGFNVAAGLITWKVSDTHNALITAIPGEIIGEAQIWSQPGQPMADFEKYKLEFGPLPLQGDNAHIPATGLMLSFKF